MGKICKRRQESVLTGRLQALEVPSGILTAVPSVLECKTGNCLESLNLMGR